RSDRSDRSPRIWRRAWGAALSGCTEPPAGAASRRGVRPAALLRTLPPSRMRLRASARPADLRARKVDGPRVGTTSFGQRSHGNAGRAPSVLFDEAGERVGAPGLIRSQGRKGDGMKRYAFLVAASAAMGVLMSFAPGALAVRPNCSEPGLDALCTEVADSIGYAGEYTGHDEPSLLFYSNTPGSGNSNTYQLTLPGEPKVLPNQAGTAGTWNFQLHIA